MFKTHGLQIYILHHKNELHVSFIITNTSSVHVSQFYTVLCLLFIPYLRTASKLCLYSEHHFRVQWLTAQQEKAKLLKM